MTLGILQLSGTMFIIGSFICYAAVRKYRPRDLTLGVIAALLFIVGMIILGVGLF